MGILSQLAGFLSSPVSEPGLFEWPDFTLLCWDGFATEADEHRAELVREGNWVSEGIVIVLCSCLFRGSLSNLAAVTNGESSSCVWLERTLPPFRGFSDAFLGGALVTRRRLALSRTPWICSCLLANTWEAFCISRKRIDLSFSSCCSSRLSLVWWTEFLFKAELSSPEAVMFHRKTHRIRNSWEMSGFTVSIANVTSQSVGSDLFNGTQWPGFCWYFPLFRGLGLISGLRHAGKDYYILF